MNNIVLPVFFQQKDNDYYKNGIKHYQQASGYKASFSDIENIINNIKKKFISYENVFKAKQILYLIYSLFKNNDHTEPFGEGNDNGKPLEYDKYAFQSNRTSESLGIYHAHISSTDNDILIWYFMENVGSELTLHFEYMKHPSSYKNVLKRIYSIGDNTNNKGINLDNGELFENTKYILENNILKFNEFLLENFKSETNNTLYHYTLVDNLDYIMFEGLLPNKNTNYTNGVNGVFLTNRINQYNANLPQHLIDELDYYYDELGDEEDIIENRPIVRLTISLKELDNYLFVPDDDYLLNQYNYNKAKTLEEQKEESLDIWGSIAYKGIIPPSNIIEQSFDY